MTITVPRRQFFVSAGLGAAGALATPLPAVLAAQPTPSRDDAVMEHVGREMARLYTLSRRQNLFAEHFQTMAANLRLLALVCPDVRAGARKPRGPHDHGRHARQVEEVRRHLGVDISGEPEPAPLSAADDAKARARLFAEGLGPTLLRMADAAEARAAQMARAGSSVPFRQAQWSLMCTFQAELQLASQILCDVSTAGVGGVPVKIACYVAQITVVVWRLTC